MAIKELWEESGIECPKCGAKNPSDAVFCIKCGTRLKLGKDGSDLLLSFTLVIALTSLVDLLFNKGVSSLLQANQSFGILFLLGLISCGIIFYVWYKYRSMGYPREGGVYKLFILANIFLLGVYAVFYFVFFLVGLIAISPLWIVFLWVLYRIIWKHE